MGKNVKKTATKPKRTAPPKGRAAKSRIAKKFAGTVLSHKIKLTAKPAAPGRWVSETEISRLHDTLREAQETLDAIRSGEVDAVVVSGAKGNQIYSLTSAEQPYRIYVERMQEGAVTVSADALVLYCNQKFADLMQLPLERVIGSQLLTYLKAEAWQKISGIFNGKEDVVKHECVLQRENGGMLPVNLTANRLPQEGANVMCLVVTDLTEQKKHEKLRLDKEVAEKASLAKDDFLAALSHELRTPLTPVLMTAIALEQNVTLPKEAREALGLIKRNVELEARLIDDLLDLTRISKGKLELHLKELDFHTIVERAVEICRSEFSSKSQVISLNLDAGKHHTEGDAVRIQQAIWNLIRNAAKFTSPKGAITIRTRNPSPDKIGLEVEDTGIGFEPAATEKLFQAFEQGGRQITRQFGGLGLGLTITRSIVEAHGGTVHATSKGIGKGAVFGFEIPVLIGQTVPAKAGAATRPSQAFSKKRILLVEDHKDTRTSLEYLLHKIKHEVKSAATAKEALRLASEYEFDLVISDIGLPDQSGLELMQQLKNKFNLKGIGLSGYGMEDDIAKSRAAGFIQHLTKPIRFDDLKQVISEIVTDA
jgi:PAS domain S-box-containing protein